MKPARRSDSLWPATLNQLQPIGMPPGFIQSFQRLSSIKEDPVRQRVIVCPLTQNQGAYLLCRMPLHRGAFPGQWALSGGGLEPDERIEEGLRREIREELGHALQIGAVQPWTFRDDIRTKLYPDGSSEQIHMIYLIFDCEALNRDVTINEEFDAHAWVEPKDLGAYDLNAATRITLLAKELLSS
ncbi:nucleoside triphosphatase NudI [Stenotrophomonas maltophilia]|nr:nucleoside triphosphatase NudI [Stenotrophomonas maltophilia]